MPEITLEVLTLDSVPLSELRRCRFDSNGGTIGRDEVNTLVLEDVHRRVSRLHATITFPAGIPTITNASTSLQMGVGELTLDCGKAMHLSAGDMLEIGPYVLSVGSTAAIDIAMQAAPGLQLSQEAGSVAQREVLQVSDAPAVGPMNLPQQSIPSRFNPPAMGDDPFADLLAGIGSASFNGVSSAGVIDAAVVPPFGQRGRAEAPLAASPGLSSDPLAALGFGTDGPADLQEPAVGYASPAPSSLPPDFNPFDLPSSVDRNSADPLSSLRSDTVESVRPMVNQGEPSIDSLFAGSGASTFEGISLGSAASAAWSSAPDSLLVAPLSSDPLALFGESLLPPAPGLRPVRDDRPEIGGAYQPPRALERKPSVVAPVGTAPKPKAMAQAAACAPNPSVEALTEGFLRGANLAANVLPNGLTPEIMAIIGSLLRSATSGAIDMLAARAATKLEVQANVTIISANANNPLKFLPNADAALQQLLGMRMPGFMRADEAMKDAFDDLRAHEVGVIAGTRAALTEVLGKFDPAVLGEKLAGGSILESLLPSVRKTKLWDVYLDRYAQIRLEAEDDFQSIFGRAFVNAYERETARMKARQTAHGEPQ